MNNDSVVVRFPRPFRKRWPHQMEPPRSPKQYSQDMRPSILPDGQLVSWRGLGRKGWVVFIETHDERSWRLFNENYALRYVEMLEEEGPEAAAAFMRLYPRIHKHFFSQEGSLDHNLPWMALSYLATLPSSQEEKAND